jgi:CRP-like cAMP-binding protein
LQVYSVRDHPIIYSQGDIGWEIYFIASGVVSISLPSDFTDLDATGRENAAENKQKYDSIGLILGAGNHVGESCICSESGVRQETVMARTMKVKSIDWFYHFDRKSSILHSAEFSFLG